MSSGHSLPANQKSTLREKVAKVMKKCDLDGDCQFNMEEMADAWADLGLGRETGTHKALAKSAPPSFTELITEGNVVPDELDVHDSYHANVTGEERGYRFKAGRDQWLKNNEENLAKLGNWSSVDPEYLDEYAVDPEYMFSYGIINGKSVNMQELRPAVIEAKRVM